MQSFIPVIQPGSSHAQNKNASHIMQFLDALFFELFTEITKEISHALKKDRDESRMQHFLIDTSVCDTTNMADVCNTPSLNLLFEFFLEVFRCVRSLLTSSSLVCR